MKYPEDNIQSQYAASRILRDLVEGMNLRIDPESDIDLFYDTFFNIYTAAGVGLDNWGAILGIGRYWEIDRSDTLGFAGSGLRPFDQGPFYFPGLTKTYRLEDDSYRSLLLFKAFVNICAVDPATLNVLIGKFFEGRGGAYVIETGPMSIRYIFEFTMTPFERSMFRLPLLSGKIFGFAGSGLQPFGQGTFNRNPYGRDTLTSPYFPPRPAGVGYAWLEADPQNTFGFAGSGLQPFDQGTFNRGLSRP